jgi:hypothetical protein
MNNSIFFIVKRMKNISLFFGLILALSYNTYAQSQITENILTLDSLSTSPKAKISDVSWISGTWKGTAFGGITEEIWSEPLGDSMMASFKLVANGTVQFYEIEIIREIKESLVLQLKHFHGDLKGWETKDETIDFPLVKISENTIYFDGMTFDKISENEMNVYVLMSEKDGSKNELKFNYKK